MRKKKKAAGPLTDLHRHRVCLANQLAADLFTAADTCHSLEMLSQLQSGQYSEIVSASVVPTDYTNADTFGRDYLCVELMSKFPKWELGIDRAAVALSKFRQVETRLESLSTRDNPQVVLGEIRSTMRAVEMTARRKIELILNPGKRDMFDWDEAFRSFAFGKGASTSLPRRRGDSCFKFGAIRPHVSYNALPLANALTGVIPRWVFSPEVVSGSRITTVPKNAKTDRVIAIEPDLNMFFQKGIGRVIRRRLQRRGLLSEFAQHENAVLAREGSATGLLATVDLSSASDSISLEVVRRLLPPDWCDALEQCRSPMSTLPSGEQVLLRKISSMGNGYTFELETLIFYGLALSVIELFSLKGEDTRCKVYGDDIVISSRLVPALGLVLNYFGFEMNPKKTFSSGPFRESCGKHYFLGSDVTPLYVKGPIDTIPRVCWAANQIRRFARMPVWGLDSRYQPAYNRLVGTLPPFFQNLRIPEGYGDGGLIADWDEAVPSRAWRGAEGWHYRPFQAKDRLEELEGIGMLLKSLHSLEGSPVKLEHEASSYPIASSWRLAKKGKLNAPQWPSFGPWL